MSGYLEKFGRQVVLNGYRLVTIRPRQPGESEKFGKAPGTIVPYELTPRWQDSQHTVESLAELIEQGNGPCGVGVMTTDTPAVDIDCTDAATVEKIKAFVIKRLGPTIERIGNAPKTLLLFATDEPFKKVVSRGYMQGKVEVLGRGQQFVALAQHPITGSPYVWRDGASVANVETWELQKITFDDARAICDEFDRMAAEAGWAVKSEPSRGNIALLDDPFVSDTPRVTDLSFSEMKQMLEHMPNDDDYDTWLNVGMACYHQWSGDATGLDLWLDWSERSSKHDDGFCRQKWESGTFEVEGKGVAPTTFRYIIQRAHKADVEEVKSRFDEAMSAILLSKSKEELGKACVLARKIKVDEFDRMDLMSALRKTYATITGETLLKSKAAEMVRYSPTAVPDRPEWLEGFVFVEADKSFYNTRSGRLVSKEVFNDVHGRLLLTQQERAEGKCKPAYLPSDVAMNLHKIPVVADRTYAPSESDLLFARNGVDLVNTYAERGLPLIPTTYTASGKSAIDRLQRHIGHLIANQRDAEIFTSFLAYIVQTRKRVNWGVFLQGAQGDGKTFFTELMGAVLGADNVNVINGQTLEDTFTGWAEGSLMVFVEEVRLGGENRYKVIDKAKTLITNNTISVRRMHRESTKMPNTSSYFLISNYRDALPVGEEDNRYFPVFSRWQDQDKLREFKEANPSYYSDLYASITEAGSLRKWFLGYRLSPHFNPNDRAPISSHKAEMIESSTDPVAEMLKELIRGGNEPDFCPTLIDNAKISEKLYDADAPTIPSGHKLRDMMQKIGFTSLGQVKVEGRNRRFWTADPERFRALDSHGVGVTDTDSVRFYLSDTL